MNLTGEVIAREAHRHCLKDHHVHDYTRHKAAWLYATAFEHIDISAKDLVDTIIELAGDPEKGEWTRHPAPRVVMDRLREKRLISG